MTENRLNSLAQMNIYKQIEINPELLDEKVKKKGKLI